MGLGATDYITPAEFGRGQVLEQRRQQFRAQAARGDLVPERNHEALREVFSPEEFAELEARNREALQARSAAYTAERQRRELVRMTDRVLAEWDAERRNQAQAEARRRLGIEG